MELDETQQLLRDQLRKYLTAELEPRTARFESGEELPYAFMRTMTKDLGLAPDSDAGGSVLTGRTYDLILAEIARVNPGFGMSWGASVNLCGGAVRTLGTKDQAERYAGPLERSEQIGAWCLTEPGAGSDAFRSMGTRAVRGPDGFRLTGTKTFITNAPHADVFLVYAKGGSDGSIQAFIVERAFEGVSVGPPFRKMGMKSSPTGELFLDDVLVPEENLLGGGIGDRDHVRRSLTGERVGIAAMSYGIAERCFEIARDYAKQRVQGGRPISEYQLVQNRLARMYVAISNVRRFVFSPSPDLSVLDVCAGKLYAAEVGSFVAEQAIHILGGYGYMEEYVVERLARDAKLLELGGGTTEMQVLTIARELLRDSSGG